MTATMLGETGLWRQRGARGNPPQLGSGQCVSEHTGCCRSACLARGGGHPAREGVRLLKIAIQTWRWACAGGPRRPTAGASASVWVRAASQVVGMSLTCEKVCANSWQEVFLCLNEHSGMSTFLQASLLFSLPIYFVLTSQSRAALILLEGLDVSQRDVNITPARQNRGTAQTVGSSTGLPAPNSRSIMQGPEGAGGRSGTETYLPLGGRAACSCTAAREEGEQQFSGSGYRGGF